MGRAIIILNRGKSESMQGLSLLSCPGGASASLVQAILFLVSKFFCWDSSLSWTDNYFNVISTCISCYLPCFWTILRN